ncbi:MAG: thioredoxin family protein [Williamsia sp.]|nr:thioredoxin family protein [Williamsia sp.]
MQLHAQTGEAKLYNPSAPAESEIAGVIKKAKQEKKHVLIQAGGNWCVWCLEFNRFTHTDQQIDSLLAADYIVYHLNYSPENKNPSVMAKFGYPQRFGFPVFIILDENGNQLHTQNSAYLEQGKSYNKAKVMEFLRGWNRAALNPAFYKNM